MTTPETLLAAALKAAMDSESEHSPFWPTLPYYTDDPDPMGRGATKLLEASPALRATLVRGLGMTEGLDDTASRESTDVALMEVENERIRQDVKWGEQNHDLTIWMTVLGEEFGETCHAALHYRAAAGRAENVEGDTDPAAWLEKVRKEAIQTAAVATAIVEFIDRGMQPTPEDDR